MKMARALLWAMAGGGAAVVGARLLQALDAAGDPFFPWWMKLLAGLGLASALLAVVLAFARGPGRKMTAPGPGRYLGAGLTGRAAIDSLAFVIFASLTFALLPEPALRGIKDDPLSGSHPRTVKAARVQTEGQPFATLAILSEEERKAGDELIPVLLLDSNRADQFALFDHYGHQLRQGGNQSCAHCHHMNLPLDQATTCTACHRRMFLPTNIFNHPLHQKKLGGNRGCRQCHSRPDLPKTRGNATPCLECHRDMVQAESRLGPDLTPADYAPGYMDAMHGLCLQCHLEAVAARPALTDRFGECATCHPQVSPDYLQRLPAYPGNQD